MLILDRHNRSTKLTDFLARAKKEIGDWHFVNIKILHGSKNKLDNAVSILVQDMSHYEGAIFKVDDYKILILGNFGKVENHGKFRRQFEKKIYRLGCRVVSKEVSEELLDKIEVDFVLRDGNIDDTLYKNREERLTNTFLCIDDSQSILEYYDDYLGKYGRVTTLSNPLKTLDKYVDKNPDVVFLDINMPEESGFNILKELRDLDPDSFVIMVSTEAKKENILQAVSLGAVGFLTKPIQPERLDFYVSSCTTFYESLARRSQANDEKVCEG